MDGRATAREACGFQVFRGTVDACLKLPAVRRFTFDRRLRADLAVARLTGEGDKPADPHEAEHRGHGPVPSKLFDYLPGKH